LSRIKQISSKENFSKIGLILVIVLSLLLLISGVLYLGEGVVYTSPMILILNILFLTVTGIALAVISAKSYFDECSTNLLLLGMATVSG
jgi:uncharacterized membrane protein